MIILCVLCSLVLLFTSIYKKKQAIEAHRNAEESVSKFMVSWDEAIMELLLLLVSMRTQNVIQGLQTQWTIADPAI